MANITLALQAQPAHEEVWWSEAEFREAIGQAASVSDEALDAVFTEYTDHLVAVGILRRVRRFGVPGYAFRRVGVVVTTIGGGH